MNHTKGWPETVKDIAVILLYAFIAWLLIDDLRRQNAELQKQISTCPVLSGEIGSHHWIYQNGDPEKALLENSELRKQNAELRECLKVKDDALRIFSTGHFPEWWLSDEPNTIANKALAAQPEGGAK